MISKTIILLILTFSLVNSTSYKGKKPDCAKITCGLDCQGSCGWSSYYNKCKYGFTTSKHELNKGPGCKTKSNDDSKDGSEDESEDGSEDKSEDGTQGTPEDTTVNSTVHTSTTTISLSTTTPTYTTTTISTEITSKTTNTDAKLNTITTSHSSNTDAISLTDTTSTISLLTTSTSTTPTVIYSNTKTLGTPRNIIPETKYTPVTSNAIFLNLTIPSLRTVTKPNLISRSENFEDSTKNIDTTSDTASTVTTTSTLITTSSTTIKPKSITISSIIPGLVITEDVEITTSKIDDVEDNNSIGKNIQNNKSAGNANEQLNVILPIVILLVVLVGLGTYIRKRVSNDTNNGDKTIQDKFDIPPRFNTNSPVANAENLYLQPTSVKNKADNINLYAEVEENNMYSFASMSTWPTSNDYEYEDSEITNAFDTEYQDSNLENTDENKKEVEYDLANNNIPTVSYDLAGNLLETGLYQEPENENEYDMAD